MRIEYNRAKFFSQKEFKDLRLPKLSFQEYKQFITDWNLMIVEEVLENPKGYQLPLDFGLLKITKRKMDKPIQTAHRNILKLGLEHNLHSFGWLYAIMLFSFNSFKISKKTLGRKFTSFRNLYQFTANRTHIKRPLSVIIKKGIRDYEKYTQLGDNHR